jgi:hypothetical protein
MNSENVVKVVIDLCSKSFLTVGDKGTKKTIVCEKTAQFIKILRVIKKQLDEDQIEFKEVALTTNESIEH